LNKVEEGKLEIKLFQKTSLKRKLQRLATKGFLMDVDKLRVLIQKFVPENMTFKSAYEKTGKILNISISNEFEGTYVLNYVTAPNVYIW
jgi:hypothetical protein